MDEDGVIFLGALYGRDRFGSILGTYGMKQNCRKKSNYKFWTEEKDTKCIWKSQIRKLETIYD